MEGYVSDASSSDASVTSVLPNGRLLTSFMAHDITVKTEKASSRTSSSSSYQSYQLLDSYPSSLADGDSSDANLERVRSDIPQPARPPPAARALSPAVPEATLQRLPHAPQSEIKRTMSATQRERLSQLLRERWANGKMDGVHDKIKQNKKRKSLQDSAGAVNGRPSKRTASSPDWPPAKAATLSGPPYAHTIGCTPGQLELWEYIRPYLDTFKDKPIPKRAWVPQLLALPRERDLVFNSRRLSSKCRFVDKDDKKVAALLLHVTGVEARQPCSRCASGSGVFSGCVKLSPNASVGDNIRNCANCWYSHQACTYETSPADNQNTSATERDRIPAKDESVLQATDSDEEEEEDDSDRIRDAPETTATGAAKPQAIIRAPSGRPYGKWPDPSGNLKTMTGNVLVPDGYMLDAGCQMPCSCPVDECHRHRLANPRGLGFHFQRHHFGQLLNDNCDGTFSVAGVYDERKLAFGGGWPEGGPPSLPIVISQIPKGPASGLTKRQAHSSSSFTDPYDMQESEPEGEVEVIAQATPGPEGPRRDLATWQYIKPFLKKHTEVPDKGWVKQLLTLSRVRDLRWNPDHAGEFYNKQPRDISCLLVQVTGDEPPKPCTRCLQGRGPLAGCVVISKDAPPEVRARIVSCANCNIQNRQVDCSAKNWVVNRPQPPWEGYMGLGRSGATTVKQSASALTASAASHRRSGLPNNDRPGHTATDGQQAEPSEGSDTEDGGLRQPSGPAGSRNVREITRRPPSPKRDKLASTPAAVPRERYSAVEMLELQDWELAPGRIVDGTWESQDMIGLSRAYLSSRKSRLHNDLEVHNEVITSGSKLSFAPAADKFRSCFVGSGRLNVKIGENPEFALSHGSSFTIPAGDSAWAQNRLCIEALLHVSTMTIYD